MYLDSSEREGIRKQALIVGAKARIIEELPRNTQDNEELKKYQDIISSYYDLFGVIDSRLDDDIDKIKDLESAKIVTNLLDLYAKQKVNFKVDVESQGSIAYKTGILNDDYKNLISIYDGYLSDWELYLNKQKGDGTID
jgi:hypothetical protein